MRMTRPVGKGGMALMSKEASVPNERLRRARSLKGWSQPDLAAEVGTSFEMVSRWERGVTIPSPYYRQRLCAVLGESIEELGLLGDTTSPIALPPAPFAVIVSSHRDAEKPVVAQLKALLQERGMMPWSSRQLGRQDRETPRGALRAAIQ